MVHAAIEKLVLANRILANEGVVDGFGHVSVRDPDDPGRYLLSRAVSPELVTADDVLGFTLDNVHDGPRGTRVYSERVIHGAVYSARPDVGAVMSISPLQVTLTLPQLLPPLLSPRTMVTPSVAETLPLPEILKSPPSRKYVPASRVSVPLLLLEILQ